MSAAVVERPREARMDALTLANEVRFARAQMKYALRTSLRPMSMCAEIVGSPPASVLTMKLFKLLVALPHVGPVKARKMMLRTRVSEAKTVGGLSQRQRDEIVAVLLAREVPADA